MILRVNYPTMTEDNLSNRTYHYYNNNTGRKTQFTDALSNNEYYYYDNSNRLIQVTDRLQNSAYYGYDPADNLVSSRDPRSSNNTDNRYLTQFVPNALNQTGTITDPRGCPLNNPTEVSQPFRYAGYYYDEETGLYYLKSRYYSPTLGRFLTRDGYGYIKYGNPQTLNLYAYAENNPVSNTDPSGHFVPLLAGGAAAVSGEAAAIAAVGTAAIGATVELAKEVKGAWDWYWAQDDVSGDNDVTAKDQVKIIGVD
jgi:RHS repeat-associated protein